MRDRMVWSGMVERSTPSIKIFPCRMVSSRRIERIIELLPLPVRPQMQIFSPLLIFREISLNTSSEFGLLGSLVSSRHKTCPGERSEVKFAYL